MSESVLVRAAGLTKEKADSPVETLSGGMRRRLTIARSLINNPDMVLLDEPTTGLDPQARHVLWDRLYRLKQDGVTLLLTTHYMEEAEQLCDRLMIIDHGRIVAQGSPRELIEAHVTREVLEVRFALDGKEAAGAKLRTSELGGDGADAGPRVEILPDRVLVYADDGESALASVHGMSLVPLLFLLGVGAGLGHLVDRHAPAQMAGVSYAAFFAPGLLAAAARKAPPEVRKALRNKSSGAGSRFVTWTLGYRTDPLTISNASMFAGR